jgi:hypothetical protein
MLTSSQESGFSASGAESRPARGAPAIESRSSRRAVAQRPSAYITIRNQAPRVAGQELDAPYRTKAKTAQIKEALANAGFS